MKLYCAIYVSRPHPGLTSEDVLAILQKAREHNEESDVSGALFMNPGLFIQVLEGPAQAVNETFARIVGDARHTDVRLLWFGRIAARKFGTWHMRSLALAHHALSFDALAARDLDDSDVRQLIEELGASAPAMARGDRFEQISAHVR